MAGAKAKGKLVKRPIAMQAIAAEIAVAHSTALESIPVEDRIAGFTANI